MGSGDRRGGRHRAAAHHRRAQQNRRRRRRRNHRAHAHHNNGHHFQSHIIFGAVTRRRANAQTSQGVENVTSLTSGTNSNRQSLPLIAYFPMCRVLSVFLWFAGIMMMSLGGFRTPMGFIGVGCLVTGILLLIFTSLVMSNSCAGRRPNNTDPEQPVPPNRPGANNPNNPAFRPVRPVAEISQPAAAPFGDSVPAYPSPDPTNDKPPSYEEVMAGQFPPTVSATVLAPIPEDVDTQQGLSQGMTTPSPPIMPPYPINNLQAQDLGYPIIQPYSPMDTQSYQRTENERIVNAGALYPPPMTNTQLDHHVAMDTSYQMDTPQSTVEGDRSQTVSSFVPQLEPTCEEVDPDIPSVPPQPQVSPPTPTAPVVQTSVSSNRLPTVQTDTLQASPVEPLSQTETLSTETSMHLSDDTTAPNNSVEHSSHVNTEVITMVSESEGTDNEGRTDLQAKYGNGLPQSLNATLSTNLHSEC